VKKTFFVVIILIVGLNLIYSQAIRIDWPAWGRKFYKGDLLRIRWVKSGDMNDLVKIRLFKGTEKTRVVDSTDNDGSFDWQIPSDFPSGTYYVRVKTVDNQVYDDSDYFSIEEKPTITITSPGSGSIWTRGTTLRIEWIKKGEMRDKVSINLHAPLMRINITERTDNDGFYKWDIPPDLRADEYYIKIKTSDNQIYGKSPEFRIVSGRKRIIIKNPNGGEKWYAGKKYKIKWNKYEEMADNVKICLLRGNTEVKTITNSTPNNGVYIWRIPATIKSGTYKVRILTVDSIVFNESKHFTIISPLVITNPNGRTVWKRGRKYEIRWKQWKILPDSILQITLYDLFGRKILTINKVIPVRKGSFKLTIPRNMKRGRYIIEIDIMGSPISTKSQVFEIK